MLSYDYVPNLAMFLIIACYIDHKLMLFQITTELLKITFKRICMQYSIT